MSRSVYRERSSDTREWDEQPRRTYTTVKRYQIPESRSTVDDEESTTTKEKIIIRRERSAQPRERERDAEDIKIRITERDRDTGRGGDDEDFRFSERLNISESQRDRGRDTSYRVTEKESDFEESRSRVNYRSSDNRSSFVERETRGGGDDQVREYRFERDRDFSPPQQSRYTRDDSYEVERYVKETDYYERERPQPQIIIRERSRDPPPPQVIIRERSRDPPPPQVIIRERSRDPAPPVIIREKSREPPQPIIIQEAAPQPIIIREGRREPRYEFIEEERDESKSVVKSEKSEQPPPSPSPSRHSMHTERQVDQEQDENYFYERRVIERERPQPRRRERDSHEIRPRDSASNYSSEDSYERVRKSTTYYEDRDASPHHRRHLAEGALVGAAAGEIIRHHRLSQGQAGGGRFTSGVGGAAVGALGAEAISRFRSRSRRRRSESRSDSEDSRRSRHRERRSRSRSRSRSQSMSRKRLLSYAGVATLGALGAYALSQRKQKSETIIVNDGGRPPRYGRRSLSEDDYYSDRDVREDDKHRDPKHRNQRIAQAGLATAAAAGILERVRSKSKGGRHRDKSRLAQGVPIAAAGIGGAALAGLYEKNKASKEAKRDAIIEDEMNRGRRGSRSRSRSRAASTRRGYDDRGYGYGNDPVYSRDPRDRYSDEEPGQYRRRGGSASSSPDNRNRRRSRSRNARKDEAAAAAGAAGVAAYELGKRRGHKGTEHREYAEYGDPYHGHGADGYAPNPYEQPSGYLPPGGGYDSNAYPNQQQHQQYPSSHYFPPPPTGGPAGENQYSYSPRQENANPYPTYNPADYAQAGPAPPHQNFYGDANTRDLHEHGGMVNEGSATPANGGPTYPPPPAGGEAYPAQTEHQHRQATPENERGRGRATGDPNDVSVPPSPPDGRAREGATTTDAADGLATPRARSLSRVRFNLDANESHSPELARRKTHRKRGDDDNDESNRDVGDENDGTTGGDRKRRHRRRDRSSSRNRSSAAKHASEAGKDDPSSSSHRHRRRHRSRGRDGEEDEDSDGTVDLPDRFDEEGNRKEGGDALQALIGGLASRFLGGGGGAEEDGRGRRGRGSRH